LNTNQPQFILQSDPATPLEKRIVRAEGLLGRCDVAGSLSLHDVHGLPRQCVPDAACPVGTVEFCRAWMSANGIAEPPALDYPDALSGALRRVVRRTTFGQAEIGSWVKPQRTKAWEPHAKNSDREHPVEELVWESAVIHEQDWLAEWRVYVLGGQIIGEGRYDSGPDDTLSYDRDLVASWVAAYGASGEAPVGYALDVALWANGQTALVEVTDAWAIGYYRGTCTPTGYARMLWARWRQLCGGSSSDVDADLLAKNFRHAIHYSD
jgi:hypothetical protein